MATQTLQQKRAKYALEQVQKCAADPQCDNKKFKSRASELPFMIHANGLGQALAFFKSKKNKDGYDYLYDILSGWLVKDERPFHGKNNALEGVTKCDRQVYLAAQAEAIMLMDWVKKFAAAFMDGDAR